MNAKPFCTWDFYLNKMLYLVPKSVVLAVILCYHLFSLGRLFVKSEKNVLIVC